MVLSSRPNYLPFFASLAFLGCFLGILLLSGCKRPFSDRAQQESVFRFSVIGAPITIDPVKSSTQYANLMTTSIYDQLYEYKYLARPYALKPRLAEAMPEVSEDGLVYTIRMKKGIRYADHKCFPDGKGREVIAQDFVYSVKRMFDPTNLPSGESLWQGKIVGIDEWKEAGSDYSQDIEGLQALDDHTIQIKVKAPYPQLIYTLAMGYSSVVPREAVEHYGKEIGINPVGSGPWILKSFTSKKVVMVRNPNYREEYFDLEDEGYDPDTQAWAGLEILQGKRLPIMDSAEVYFMKEPMPRWNSLNKGTEIQFGAIPTELTHMVTESLQPFELKPEYDEKFTARLEPDFGLVMLYFNMADPRIGHVPDDPEQERKNLLLRKAIQAAWNWPQRNDRFYHGLGKVFAGTIPPGLDGFDEELGKEFEKPNLEEAMSLLEEGGWTPDNLPELEYCGVAGIRHNQTYEQFRGWMQKIGYPREKITTRSFATFGDFNKAVKNRECTLIGMGWGLDYPDEENVLQLFYGKNASPGSNSANFVNAEYDKLFEQASVMLPGPERTKIYRQLNEMLVDQVPAILGLSRTTPNLWHKNVVYFPSKNPHGSLLKYAYVSHKSEE